MMDEMSLYTGFFSVKNSRQLTKLIVIHFVSLIPLIGKINDKRKRIERVDNIINNVPLGRIIFSF
jgi:hypothetical protein